MCGRYQRRSDKQRIAEADIDLAPNYNVAPQTMQPIIVWDEAAGTRVLHMMFWRFLPPFVADLKMFRLSTVNAQSERLMESIWQDSFLKRRCLIPADTFIEWQSDGKRKLPWVFAMRDGQPLALGGVWRHWRSRDRKQEMDTFAVITVEPNELVNETKHHDRMSLIVKRSDWQRWLEPNVAEQPPIDLLRPFDADKIKAWRADTAINNARNTGADLGEPLPDDSEEPPKLLF